MYVIKMRCHVVAPRQSVEILNKLSAGKDVSFYVNIKKKIFNNNLPC